MISWLITERDRQQISGGEAPPFFNHVAGGQE